VFIISLHFTFGIRLIGVWLVVWLVLIVWLIVWLVLRLIVWLVLRLICLLIRVRLIGGRLIDRSSIRLVSSILRIERGSVGRGLVVTGLGWIVGICGLRGISRSGLISNFRQGIISNEGGSDESGYPEGGLLTIVYPAEPGKSKEY
jgi:hypothetical protein